MASLGQLLVPERLHRALLWASRTAPLSVVVEPASALAWLPLGLLAVETVPDRPRFRLLERAILRVAAPLIDLPATTDGPPADGLLAILDPTNDFPVLGRLADRADDFLSGSDLADRSDGRSRGEATIESVLSALADADRYQTLLYAGHARSGTADDPLGAGLRLGIADEKAILSVAQLLEHRASLRSPETVVLCGCSTGADDAPNEIERWGLPTTFLLAGARSVVATTWDVVACADTVDFIEELLSAMSKHHPAAAVRLVQMDRLDRWNRAVAGGDTAFDPDSLGNAHPYLWASFVAVA
jgi:CHAT domain-containing protein